MTRAISAILLAALAVPAQARGLRFHCLVTGARDLAACCCTGSTTEACRGGCSGPGAAASCGSS